MSQPLAGLRVLDFGQVVAIPFATQWLAWMGADVVLVETRRHMTARALPPFAGDIEHPDRSGLFNGLNGTKRSVQLNLTTQHGRDVARQLVSISDVIVDNYGTGMMERFGLSWIDVSRLQPDIIMLSLGAFGRSGPARQDLGFHSAVNLFSGVADLTGYAGGGPRLLGGLMPDPISGVYCLFSLLTALHLRQRTGKGQYIDGAMYETMLPIAAETMIDLSLNDREPVRMGNRDRHKVPHGIYRSSGEDAWVAISVETFDQWQALCRVIGREDLVGMDTVGSRRQHEDAIDAAIEEWTRTRTPLQAMADLQAVSVAAGPASRPNDLLADPQLQSRGFFVENDHPVAGRRVYSGLPWLVDGRDPAQYGPSPTLGQHTGETMQNLLGIDGDNYASLIQNGVLQ